MEQNDATVGRAYTVPVEKAAGSAGPVWFSTPIPYREEIRPVAAHSWNSRAIRSPLDMSAGAGMFANSVQQLSRGGINRLIRRFVSLGMSQKDARQAVMQMIEAGHIQGRVL